MLWIISALALLYIAGLVYTIRLGMRNRRENREFQERMAAMQEQIQENYGGKSS